MSKTTRQTTFTGKLFDVVMMKTIIERKLFWCNDEKYSIHIQDYFNVVSMVKHIFNIVISIVEGWTTFTHLLQVSGNLPKKSKKRRRQFTCILIFKFNLYFCGENSITVVVNFSLGLCYICKTGKC